MTEQQYLHDLIAFAVATIPCLAVPALLLAAFVELHKQRSRGKRRPRTVEVRP